MIDEIVDTIKSVNHDVYLIILADASQPPGNPLPHFRRTVSKINDLPHLQLAITVDNGMHTFLRMCLEVIVRIHSPNWTSKLPFLRTLEDATRLIKEHRQMRINVK